MSLNGMRVSHARFGGGEIVSSDGRYVSVRFSTDGQLRQFPFPDAFEGYLRVEAGDRAPIDEALRARKLELLTRKQEQQQRLQAMQRERRAERAAARKPPARRTAASAAKTLSD